MAMGQTAQTTIRDVLKQARERAAATARQHTGPGLIDSTARAACRLISQKAADAEAMLRNGADPEAAAAEYFCGVLRVQQMIGANTNDTTIIEVQP